MVSLTACRDVVASNGAPSAARLAGQEMDERVEHAMRAEQQLLDSELAAERAFNHAVAIGQDAEWLLEKARERLEAAQAKFAARTADFVGAQQAAGAARESLRMAQAARIAGPTLSGAASASGRPIGDRPDGVNNCDAWVEG